VVLTQKFALSIVISVVQQSKRRPAKLLVWVQASVVANKFCLFFSRTMNSQLEYIKNARNMLESKAYRQKKSSNNHLHSLKFKKKSIL